MHFFLLFPFLSAALLPLTIANIIPVDDSLVEAVNNLQSLDEFGTIDDQISYNIPQEGIELPTSISPPPPRADDTYTDLERQFLEPNGACKGYSVAIHVTCEGPEVDYDPPESAGSPESPVFAFVLDCTGGRFYFFLSNLFLILPFSIRVPL